MKTEEAIKWIFDIWHEWENVYGISGEISLKEGKKMDEVIELLKRGEKFEKMWEELYKYDGFGNADCKYIMDELQQKYFPEGG